jgi:hypothetical protein
MQKLLSPKTRLESINLVDNAAKKEERLPR